MRQGPTGLQSVAHVDCEGYLGTFPCRVGLPPGPQGGRGIASRYLEHGQRAGLGIGHAGDVHGHQLDGDVVIVVAVLAPILVREARQNLSDGQRRDGLAVHAHRHVIALPDVAEPKRDLEGR